MPFNETIPSTTAGSELSPPEAAGAHVLAAASEIVPPAAATRQAVSGCDVAAWILIGVALLLILPLHLLPALLAGLLVYDLTHVLVPVMHLGRITGYRARVAAVALLAITVALLVGLAALGFAAFMRSGNESFPALLQKMAEILQDSRRILPEALLDKLPTTAEGMEVAVVDWLKGHASALEAAGKSAGRFLTHVLVGMVIGAMLSLSDARPPKARRPLSDAMALRVMRLTEAFHSIVFAQVRISALNSALTALYLTVILPLFGAHLPLTKTLIAVTFVVGLLPVVGNLISNTIIVVVSLSQSFSVAVGSMVFLVLIHKLEYFLNAKIIGARIRSEPWELLTAMLVMEAIFGMTGIIAAPIYYAYLKDELSKQGLV
jgi:predicted PurR-regulated permease PerM